MLRTLLAAALLALPAQAQHKMYFLGNGNGPDPIRSAHLDGSNIQTLVQGLPYPQAIALDTLHGTMYWTDSGVIQRANLDGTARTTILSGLGSPRGIAVDPAGGKIYFADLIQRKIRRANLDGTALQDLVTSGLNAPTPLTLDLLRSKVYWIDVNNNKIQRANLDGTNVEDVLTNHDGWGIALDPIAGHIYWTPTSSIRRADLDGSNIVTLVQGLRWARGIALDLAGGKMYWSDGVANKIQRANLDGTAVQDLITSGLDTILSLALDTCPPGAWALYGTGWPGTLGIPAISAQGTPSFGQPFAIQLANSAGVPTPATLFLGAAANLATPFGGTLLIDLAASPALLPLSLTPGTSSLTFTIPPQPYLCGAAVHAQALELDPGASHSISFTAGLRIVLGT